MEAPRELRSAVRILIVEDDPHVRRFFSSAMEGGTYSGRPILTEAVASVEEALRALETETYDLIVLDLGFRTGMQGTALMEVLRGGGADIPILVVTGGFVGLDCDKLYRLGAADVLPKPVLLFSLKDAVAQILRAAEAARRPAWRSATARVLHVEDTDDWAALVRLWLKQGDYSTHRVSSRLELMRFLRSCRELPDCILLDLSLPDTDGLSICEELKGNPSSSAIPIVVFTARAADRVAAIKHRAVQVVLKPDGTREAAGEEVMAVIASVIDQAERTRGVVRKGALRLDPRAWRVYSGARRVADLDSAKFSILRLLLERSPKAVTEEELRNCLPRVGYKRRHPEDPNPKTMAVYVSNLRAQLASEPLIQIISKPGQGYALLPLADDAS